jgi:hypothetical protein
MQTPADAAEEPVRIDSPAPGEQVVGFTEIYGRATTPDPTQFDFYRVYIGRGWPAQQLRPLAEAGTSPVEDGFLGSVDLTNARAGDGSLVLRVYAKNGETYETAIPVLVEESPHDASGTTGPIVIVPTPDVRPQLPTPQPCIPAPSP